MGKIGAVVEELDFSVGDWTFAYNTKEEPPQQTNVTLFGKSRLNENRVEALFRYNAFTTH